MDEIISIETLAGQFRDTLELQEYSDRQFLALQESAKKIRQLQEEVNHLKGLLASTTELIGDNKVVKIILTPEEALIEDQIDIIRNRSIGQELTLEDTKKLDLLLKNKNILKDNKKVIEPPAKKPTSTLSKSDLLQIASSLPKG